jgi:transcriptional regulator with XRE-family HTH domain
MKRQANLITNYRHSECDTWDNAQTMQTPGQRIRSARELAGYRQGEFARLIGCAQSTLSEIETGESKLPSAGLLSKMVELLGKSERWIIYGEDGEVQKPTPEETDLLNAFRSLPDDVRQNLVVTIKSLARVTTR